MRWGKHSEQEECTEKCINLRTNKAPQSTQATSPLGAHNAVGLSAVADLGGERQDAQPGMSY